MILVSIPCGVALEFSELEEWGWEHCLAFPARSVPLPLHPDSNSLIKLDLTRLQRVSISLPPRGTSLILADSFSIALSGPSGLTQRTVRVSSLLNGTFISSLSESASDVDVFVLSTSGTALESLTVYDGCVCVRVCIFVARNTYFY